MIAHGVSVGEHTILAAQVGVAGSSRIGSHVVLAGQVGVAGHLEIGDKARATAQTGIPNDVPAGALVSGYPAIDNRDWLKASAVFRKLPELKRRVAELEKRLAALQKKGIHRFHRFHRLENSANGSNRVTSAESATFRSALHYLRRLRSTALLASPMLDHSMRSRIAGEMTPEKNRPTRLSEPRWKFIAFSGTASSKRRMRGAEDRISAAEASPSRAKCLCPLSYKGEPWR